MPKERPDVRAALGGELSVIGRSTSEPPRRRRRENAAAPPTPAPPIIETEDADAAAAAAEQPASTVTPVRAARQRSEDAADPLIKTSIKLRVSETDYFNGIVRSAQRQNRERITASFVQRAMLRAVVELAPQIDLAEITMDNGEDLLVDRIKSALTQALEQAA